MTAVTSVAPGRTHPPSGPSPGRVGALLLGLGAAAALLSVGGRWDSALAAWIAPALLVRFSRTTRARVAMPLIVTVTVLSAVFWMAQLAVPLTPLTLIGSLTFGLAYALPYLADRALVGRLGTPGRLLLLPTAMMSVEFLLGTFGPFGAAYGLRATTQLEALGLVQVTALTGPYFIAFLVGLLATVVDAAWRRGLTAGSLRVLAGYLGILGVIVLGGQLRVALAPTGAESVRIAGVNPSQAAVDAETAVHGRSRLGVTDLRDVDHHDVAAASKLVMDDLFAQTRVAAQGGAKIVVWSENAARVLDADHDAFLRRAATVADEADIYLLVADLVYLPQAPHGRDETHLFGPNGQRLWDYEKARPIPGLESYTPGDGIIPVVATPYGRIANVICYDADFPAINHIDADIVLVPGGDWPEMGRTHTDMAALRAIENGYSLVRQDFNGQSTAFDPYGRVLSTQDTTTDSGIWYAQVPISGTGSVYRSTGDVLSWIALAATVGLAVFRPGRRRPATSSTATQISSGTRSSPAGR